MRVLYLLHCLIIVPLTSFSQVDFHRKWYAPDFITAQYAGSIGFLSAGVGYNIIHDKAHIDILFGVIPGFTRSEPLETLTAKFTGTVIRRHVNPNLTITPFTAGVYFCYTFGKEYSHDLPSWYPDGYYWWSEAVRVNLFIGGNVTATTNRLSGPRKISAYYEIGTNEIKLVSYVQNRHALTVWQILHAGVGVRYYFRE